MAGAGYKLFNTGDVLTAAQVNTYLMEQSVMVFANAAARTTALSGVLAEGMLSYLKDTDAVEVYNGSAWVASDDPNAIQNSIVDAKGDLISASADNVPARLAVGNNGESLVADSGATTGLRYQETFAAYKNKINNSNFSVWQRGTSFTGTSPFYAADRWQAWRVAAVSGGTWSRQTASLDGFQYSLRAQRNSGNTSTNGMFVTQSFESDLTRQLHGKKVTVSFWVKAGANYSSASNLLGVEIQYGTGTETSVTAGFTSSTTITLTSPTLTTSWQKVTVTTPSTIPNTATQFALLFGYVPVGTAGANDWFEITGVQLEVGEVATGWSLAAGTLAGELAACQRYYQRFGAKNGQTVGTNATYGYGFTTSTTGANFTVNYPVTMRTTPTSIEYASLVAYDAALTQYTPSAVALVSGQSGLDAGNVQFTITGATAARAAVIIQSATTGYLAFNAEL